MQPITAIAKSRRKTVDDVLRWNAAIGQILHGASHCASKVRLHCSDFKVFNPINPRLLNMRTFHCLTHLDIGLLTEALFPNDLSGHSSHALNAPSLKSLTMHFLRLTSKIVEAMIGWFRDPQFGYRPLPLEEFRVRYGERDREALLMLLQGTLSGN